MVLNTATESLLAAGNCANKLPAGISNDKRKQENGFIKYEFRIKITTNP